MKKIILSAVAVFLVWTVVDFVLHGLLLKGVYEATASLWRPMAEMKRGLMSLVTFLAALGFSALWGNFVDRKTTSNGLKFGLWYGFAVGVGMGYGSYSYMPIPYSLALAWFLVMLVEGALAGLIASRINS